MRYDYDASKECFIREDGLGKKFYINSTEAQRIITMNDLGYSTAQICAKIKFNSGKVYESTVNNFLRNVNEGNIIVSEDYPAPQLDVDDFVESNRLDDLEKRISDLEDKFSELRSDCFMTKGEDFDPVGKVKKWLNL